MALKKPKEWSTIILRKETIKLLASFKIAKRETYDEIINRLIKKK